MNILIMSHIFRIVIVRAFKKYKVCYVHLKTTEAMSGQREAGTYLSPGIVGFQNSDRNLS
jgi:hypothetical protein